MHKTTPTISNHVLIMWKNRVQAAISCIGAVWATHALTHMVMRSGYNAVQNLGLTSGLYTPLYSFLYTRCAQVKTFFQSVSSRFVHTIHRANSNYYYVYIKNY
jgi:hypothetical protein